MPAYKGTHYSRNFTFRNPEGNALDVSSWTFTAHVKDDRSDDDYVLELTSANGGFVITSGLEGGVQMNITAAQTEMLSVGTVHYDVLRTDIEPGPLWMFGGKFRVRDPVTHL